MFIGANHLTAADRATARQVPQSIVLFTARGATVMAVPAGPAAIDQLAVASDLAALVRSRKW